MKNWWLSDKYRKCFDGRPKYVGEMVCTHDGDVKLHLHRLYDTVEKADRAITQKARRMKMRRIEDGRYMFEFGASLYVKRIRRVV